MKRKEIPWGSIVGFFLLVALGIGIPFWLEYQSLTNPPAVRPIRTTNRRPAIDTRKGFYCPNCGTNVEFPQRSEAPDGANASDVPLSLKALERPGWELQRSTRSATTPGMELREDP
jgi:hypothetical protein